LCVAWLVGLRAVAGPPVRPRGAPLARRHV
jgi:hypothetical protein